MPRNSDEAYEWPDEADEASLADLLRRLALSEQLSETMEEDDQ